MPLCYMRNCTNYYSKTRSNKNKIAYHVLPAQQDLADKWIKLCGNPDDAKPPPHTRVCSDHFSPDCYQRDLQHELLGLPLRKKLKPNAVPDINLPDQNSTKPQTKPNEETETKKAKPAKNHLQHAKMDPLKNTNRLNKLPMRSSIRIAKKKSIECLSDSFTDKVNNKNKRKGMKVERFTDKLKFMAKLQLRYERNENGGIRRFQTILDGILKSAKENG